VIGRDWRHSFSAVLAGDVVAHKKPAPDIYREAVRRLGTLPQACIAFEDSAAGVASARAAGCYVVATRSEWLAGDDLRGAHLQVPHLGDPGRLWDEEHPFLHRRWLSIKDLTAWHGRHEPDTEPSPHGISAGTFRRQLGTAA
jgi:FMN phosphatase YigB (HAD superfamily)